MSAPLVVSLTTPSDSVLYVRDGHAWLLVGAKWVRLGTEHITSIGGGIAGRVLTTTQREALLARVGAP